jgi:hypothetical protein
MVANLPPSFFASGGQAKFIEQTGISCVQFGCGRKARATSLALDASGNVYVAGWTKSSYYNSAFAGGTYDAFLAKYMPATGALVYGNQFGTSGDEIGNAVAADSAGNVIVAGYTAGTMPSCLPSACSTAGGQDVFVAQYQPNTTNNAAPPPTFFAASRALSYATINTAVDPTLWFTSLVDGTGSITESGGTMNLSPAPNNGNSQQIVQSLNKHDLTKSSSEVKVTSVVSAAGHVNQIFTLQVDWNNQLNWWYESGNLYANYLLAGVQHALATLRYDPAVHVWWRFRETAGTVYWETSQDGTTWTAQGSTPTSGLFSVQSLDTIIHAREFGVGNPNPGTAKFSNVNPPP